MPRPRQKTESAFSTKGLKREEGSHHIKWKLFDERDRYTGIKTRTSRSGKDIDDTILSLIRKQLKFDTKEQLLYFIDCCWERDDYFNMLRRKEAI